MIVSVDNQRAEARIRSAVNAIVRYDEHLQLGHLAEQYDDPGWVAEARDAEDEVRAGLYVARVIARHVMPDIVAALEYDAHDGVSGYRAARRALLDLAAAISEEAELAEIIGPTGPKLSASSLHPLIWESARRLWDDGHHHRAVQFAAQALETYIQSGVDRFDVQGQDLGTFFVPDPPSDKWDRYRLPEIDASSATWTSAHTGASFLVRGAMSYVRNLASHGGAPVPTDDECLEQLALLSMVARIVERCEVDSALGRGPDTSTSSPSS